MKNTLLLFCCLLGLRLSAQSPFQAIPEFNMQLSAGAERKLVPAQFHTYQLDQEVFSALLSQAPMEFTAEAGQGKHLVDLPMADGSFETFSVWKVMACEQAVYDRHPEIRTFGGVSLRNPGKTIRGSITVRGCRIMVLSPDFNVQYIEPYAWGQTQYYMVYDRRDIPESARLNVPTAIDLPERAATETLRYSEAPPVADRGVQMSTPVVLKKFRFAVACTGEFGEDHGGTHDMAWAAVVEYSNMVSAIFERDIALRLQLIAGSEFVVYTIPASDPYTGTTVFEWAGTNTSVLNSNIGELFYDVGHVYARYLGGNASGVASGIACSSSKARGCTSGQNGYGDGFIAIIGQEVGHQLAGGHTWNRCNGGSGRNGNTAFEPGSGSTIMSYAGSCGADNVQNFKSLYYHSGSIEEIGTFVATSCAAPINTGNNNPVVTLSYTDNFFIPINTPFELNGSATDIDGDALTYAWEEIDLGPECTLTDPIGSAPLFRVWPAGNATNRYFPKLSTILNNGFDLTEQLPSISRDMTFRLIARDNKSNGGGVGWADVAFLATEDAGPFLVTSPNLASDKWLVNEFVNVTWDVANTNISPVNCQYVDILLSIDGGLTYPIVLANNVLNDGSQQIQVPNNITNQARVRINGAGNVFFDISNAKFRIEQATQPQLSIGLSTDGGQICLPDQFNTNLLSTGLAGYNNPVEVGLEGNIPPGAVTSFSTTLFQPGEPCSLHIDLNDVAVNGVFNFGVYAVSGGDTLHYPITLDLVRNDFSQLTLNSPADGISAVPTDQYVVLRWTTVPDALAYDVQFSNSPTFEPGSILASKTGTVVDTFKIPVALVKNKIYYWRVRPVNICSPHDWLDTRSLQTEVLSCTEWSANDLPKVISSNGTPTIESVIGVLSNGPITDVNVKKLDGYHTFFKDLDFKLISPQGTELVLLAQKCGNFSGNFNFALDDEALGVFPCPPPNSGSAVKPQNPLSIFDGLNQNGNWKVRVHDNTASSGGALEAFQLEFCGPGQFNNPFLVNNNPMQLQPGTNMAVSTSLLKADDIDNTAAELVFTLTNTPRFGRLEKNWTGEMKAGDTFTQAELDNGAIRYFNYSFTEAGDYFRFTVTDGEGGFLGTPKFEMYSSVPVSSGEPHDLPLEVNLYPNPATNTVWLSSNRQIDRNARITLFNTSGIALRSLEWTEGADRLNIELNGVPAGIYFVDIKCAEEHVVKRLMVIQ